MDSATQCTICNENYKRETREPKVLPCGHNICSLCLDNILVMQTQPQCPFDRKTFSPSNKHSSSFITNLLALQLSDELQEKNQDICSSHKKPNDLFCLTDQCKICEYCAKYGNHKTHNITEIQERKQDICSSHDKPNDLICLTDQCKICEYCAKHENHKTHNIIPLYNAFMEANKKIAILKPSIQTLKNHMDQIQELNSIFEGKKQSVLTKVKNNFNDLRNILNKKEEEICSEIELSFAKAKAETEDDLWTDSTLKAFLEKQIAHLSSKNVDEEFINALLNQSHKAEHLSVNIEKEQNLHNQISSILEAFEVFRKAFMQQSQAKLCPVNSNEVLPDSSEEERNMLDKLKKDKYVLFEKDGSLLTIKPKSYSEESKFRVEEKWTEVKKVHIR